MSFLVGFKVAVGLACLSDGVGFESVRITISLASSSVSEVLTPRTARCSRRSRTVSFNSVLESEDLKILVDLVVFILTSPLLGTSTERRVALT